MGNQTRFPSYKEQEISSMVRKKGRDYTLEEPVDLARNEEGMHRVSELRVSAYTKDRQYNTDVRARRMRNGKSCKSYA